jgi:hypothetical protein
MRPEDILPTLLRAAPVLVMVWVLILSVRAWRRKNGSEQ